MKDKPEGGTELIDSTNLIFTRTVGPPVNSREEISQSELRALGIGKTRTPPEYRIFRSWYPSPLVIISSRQTGTPLAELSNIVLSFFRTIDDTTGITICTETVVFQRTVFSWAPSPSARPAVRILSFANGGSLDDWTPNTAQEFDCGDNMVYTTYKKDFRPDWFDLVDSAVLTIGPALWWHC